MPKKKKEVLPKCQVPGCQKRLTEAFAAPCVKCNQPVVCKNHVYDHGCDKKDKADVVSVNNGGISVVRPLSKQNSALAAKAAEKNQTEVLAKLKSKGTFAREDLNSLIEFLHEVTLTKPFIIDTFECDRKVRDVALGYVKTYIINAECSVHRELLKSCEKFLQSSVAEVEMPTAHENLLISIISLYGTLISLIKPESMMKDLTMFTIKFRNEKLQRAFGNVLKDLTAASQDAKVDLETDFNTYISNLINGIENENRRNGHAVLISVIAQNSEQKLEEAINFIEKTLKSGKAKKLKDKEDSLLGEIKFLHILSRDMNQRISPYLLQSDLIKLLLIDFYSVVSSTVRSPLKKALMQIMKTLNSVDLELVVPVLLNGLKGNTWRTKVLCLACLGQLARRDISGLWRHLPSIVPEVMECTGDTKKEVSQGASTALEDLASVIRNPETVKLKSWLLDALKDPAKIEACLDEIMDCTFVNSIDKESLSLIMPVVYRAMREGNAELKQKSVITVGNVCSLVANVNDIRPFVQLLLPELEKLLDHSNPDVRKFAGTAKAALLEGTAKSESNDLALPKTVLQVTQRDVESLIRDKLLSNTNRKYIVNLLVPTILVHAYDELDPGIPSVMVGKYIDNEVADSIEKISSIEVCNIVSFNICEGWLKAHSRRSRNQSKMSAKSIDVSEEKDYLIYIPSIILAFASKMLLRRTVLKLEKNHRYAFVGQNGVGKTTLLNRIAAKDINGFPESVSCYYVQHEILSEDKELSVIGYMNRLIGDAVTITPEKIKTALSKVGFNENLKATAVANLSGGWRMRLAIARSMIYEAELLLLDEPTNHLDAEAIDWLQTYLTTLENTTIALVSHDYDFLTAVATDIVHIADMKLTYYECGFAEFQQQRPEIVAALPRPKAKTQKNGNTTIEGKEEISALEALSLEQDDARFKAVIKSIKPIKFPEGQKLEGITSRGKPVMSLENVFFRYPNMERFILDGVSLRLNLNSRVVLVGPNGAGKSTLMKVLIGMEDLLEEYGCRGKIWRHHNLRSAYIAQHSMHHLESSLEKSPCQYIQARFWEGRDKEVSKMLTLSLTEEEEKLTQERGEICEILSRVKRGKKLYYEIKKNGRKMKDGQTEFRTIEELEALGKPHAIKLCRMFDEKLKAAASGMDVRPLTTPEMIKHLKEFGIPEDLATRKIRWMSGGQKSRLVLAAAMWTKPHLIALDEPTNYLDNETLAALTYALKSFRGGVIAISHHQGFVNALAKEIWHVQDGKVSVQNLKKRAI